MSNLNKFIICGWHFILFWKWFIDKKNEGKIATVLTDNEALMLIRNKKWKIIISEMKLYSKLDFKIFRIKIVFIDYC